MSKAHEMLKEADAIEALLRAALADRAIKSTAEFYAQKVTTGAQRLRDAARKMLAEKGEGGANEG